MNARRALRILLLGGAWAGGTWTLVADPAVLLKEYSAQIVRGNYVLGKRIVKVGEMVTVQAIKGVNAEVTTAQNDRLLVLLADLRTLPEPTLTFAPPAKPSPSPVVVSAAAASGPAAPAAAPSVPPPAMPPDPTSSAASLTAAIATMEDKLASEPILERREVKVRCTHLTKKGKQCTRLTSSPNGFCWQHGGD